jgi:hypothetical protein
MPVIMQKQDRNAFRAAMNALSHCQRLDKKAADELEARIKELAKAKREDAGD